MLECNREEVHGQVGRWKREESPYFIQTFEHSNIQTFSQLELLVRGKKSFGHVKIDAKRVLDSGVLCTVVDLHKREEL